MFTDDQNLVQRFFDQSSAFIVRVIVILVISTPLSRARSVANKEYPDPRDVGKQSSAFLERGRERDAVVRGEDSHRPTEATGERENDLSLASAQRDAKRWTHAAGYVRGRRIVLLVHVISFLFIIHPGQGTRLGRGSQRDEHTTVAWREPLSVHKSKETRLDVAFPARMSHISAVMGPLVV
jgi:hypothetical protein